jgi:DNA alkylation repair enzyme
MSLVLTAKSFAERMHAMRSEDELRKIPRYFKTGSGEYGAGDMFMGVRMGQVFALAKEFAQMPPSEIELLLESPLHEMRAGAVSVMSKQAVWKKTTEGRRKALFDLYLRRHDRINNWDLVDLGARDVLGRYLLDKPRDVLYALARSQSLWERASA